MTCDMCGGTLMPLGVLGRLSWFRCRQCGIEFSIDEPADAEERNDGVPSHHLGEFQMDDASEADFDRWAERYDALNGAPENEDDR